MSCGRCTDEVKKRYACTLPAEKDQWAPKPDEPRKPLPTLEYHDPLFNYDMNSKRLGVKRIATDMPNGEEGDNRERFDRCAWGDTLYAPLVQEILNAYHDHKTLGVPLPDDPMVVQGCELVAAEHAKIDLEKFHLEKYGVRSKANIMTTEKATGQKPKAK